MSILLSKARGTFDQCRFVCEVVGNKADAFDGARICGAPVSLPTTYCAEHRARYYERSEKAPKPPQEFTLLHRRPEREARPELTEFFG